MLSFGHAKWADEEEVPKKGRNFAAISCPECGASTRARDDGNLCLTCARMAFDWRTPLVAHVRDHPKALSIDRCPKCFKVLTSDPHQMDRWEPMERETDELLAFTLKKVKQALLSKKALSVVTGLSTALGDGYLELADARMIWTEPHCRRLAHATPRWGRVREREKKTKESSRVSSSSSLATAARVRTSTSPGSRRTFGTSLRRVRAAAWCSGALC